MENEKFLTCLLMSIFGIILIFIAIFILILQANSIIKYSRLEQEAIPLTAEVIYKMEKRDKENIIRYTYSIEYVINEEKHNDYIEIKDSSINVGDKIVVYYLQGEEDKIYLSKENNISKNILSFILILVFFELPLSLFGIKCIKNYNVFKYKREINVQ